MQTTLSPSLKIGIILYDGFDSLDVAGPNQIFYFLTNQSEGVKLYLVGPEKGKSVTSLEGLKWEVELDYDDMQDIELDVIFVPGGAGPDFTNLLEYEEQEPDAVAHQRKGISKHFSHLLKNTDGKFDAFYKLLTSQVEKAEASFKSKKRSHRQLVCAVCTGALLLARAGLLEGFSCTTHWAYKNILSLFDGVNVAPGYPRYVIDRNRITGGGISSGLDEALAIVEIVRGAEIARQIQLSIQYAPNPPFTSGDPSVASARTLNTVSEGFDTGGLYAEIKKQLAGKK